MTDQPTEPPVSGQASQATLPCEEPQQPFFSALFETIKLFIFNPQEAFERMPVTTDIGRPLLYGVLLGWLGGIIESVWGFLFQASLFGFLANVEGMEQVLPAMALGLAGGVIGIFLAPIITLILIFIITAIVHLFLMVLGGANQGFAATLRVICYSETAQIARLVPFLGGLICLVWSIVLAVIGLVAAHRTSTGKAVAAVLLPILVCCTCWGVCILAIVGMATGLGG
jgi:hypothetical protein